MERKTSRVSVARNVNCGADKLDGDAGMRAEACRSDS